jgi:MFS family permease
MTDAAAESRSPWALLPPLAAVAAVATGAGLLQTLLPLRLSAAGFDTDEIGLVVTSYAMGFVAGCLSCPILIRSVGHVRAYCCFAAAASLIILGFELHPDPGVTVLIMGMIGIASAGISIVTESWLNELAAPEWRGRLLTAYVVILAAFWGCGQLLGLLTDPSGSHLVMLATGFYVLALIPVAAIDVVAPTPPETARIHFLKAFKVAPVGALSCLHTGLVSATFLGIGPLYGAALGLDTQQIVLLMASAQAGIVLQWPLGLLSDRGDRRWLLIFMSIALLAVGAGLIVGGGRMPFMALLLLFACFGGIAESYYPIGMAHANDRADPSEYVMISSNLLLVWAAGRMIGPIAGSSALKHGGAAGLIWYANALTGLFMLYALWRIRSAKPTTADREEFVTYPATSPGVFEWIQLKKLRKQGEGAP